MLGLENILTIILGSFRIGAMLIAMPLIGPNASLLAVRFILAIALSAIMSGFYPPISATIFERNDLVMMAIAREICLGLMIGYCSRLIFLIVTMSLEFAGLQMGFSIANMFDPQNNAQVSVVAQFGAILSFLFFLVTNLHHDIFYALIRSFQLIPMGLPDWGASNGTFLKNYGAFFTQAIAIAIRLSMPVIVAMIVIHVVMGIVSRTAPQMNLFFNIAFMVNIVVGLLLVMITFPQFFPQMEKFSKSLLGKGYGLW